MQIRYSIPAFLYILLFVAGCSTVKFVQPYDDALVVGVQGFYKSTATFLEEGKQKSPATRPDTEDPQNSGHVSQYTDGYSRLIIDANSLIIRAMVNSVRIDELGQTMQDKVTSFIDEEMPSLCMGDDAVFGGDFASLTVKNFSDLKCLITNWRVQHENAPGKTLTSFDWARRHRALLRIVVAIQRAETFKQVEKQI